MRLRDKKRTGKNGQQTEKLHTFCAWEKEEIYGYLIGGIRSCRGGSAGSCRDGRLSAGIFLSGWRAGAAFDHGGSQRQLRRNVDGRENQDRKMEADR